jgi:hypothetical protein
MGANFVCDLPICDFVRIRVDGCSVCRDDELCARNMTRIVDILIGISGVSKEHLLHLAMQAMEAFSARGFFYFNQWFGNYSELPGAGAELEKCDQIDRLGALSKA